MRIEPHNSLQASDSGGVRGLGVDPAQRVHGRFVGDVLVQRAIRLLLTEEKFNVSGREDDGSLWKEQDVASLEPGTPLLSFRLRGGMFAIQQTVDRYCHQRHS